MSVPERGSGHAVMAQPLRKRLSVEGLRSLAVRTSDGDFGVDIL